MEEWKEYRLGDFMEFNPTVRLPKNTMARKVTMDQLLPIIGLMNRMLVE